MKRARAITQHAPVTDVYSPAPDASIRLSVNGREVDVPAGATLLEAARAAQAFVPTLCKSDRLDPIGSCRLCMVEVEGWRKPVASCHTPAAAGMRVRTVTPALESARRQILELLLGEQPMDRIVSHSNAHSELLGLLLHYGLETSRFPAPAQPRLPVDDSHPFIRLDMNECVHCFRCVHVCNEVQGSFILGMAGRGAGGSIVAGNATGLETAGCVSCGACVLECPTGAIEDKSVAAADGLPLKHTSTTCVYCGVGCALIVNSAEGTIVNVEPDPAGGANRGHACVKGRYGYHFVNAADRLRTPLIRRDGQLRPASWDEAIAWIARRFGEIRDAHGPDAFAAIASSRCTNEENFLLQKFVRVVMRTNNVDNCSRLCHSPSAYGLQQALGTGAGTNSFDDIAFAKMIFVIGANPTEAHPVAGARIRQAVLRGAKLVVADPRRIELTDIADVHMALRPGANVALINAIGHAILDEGLENREFIERYTAGGAEIREFLKAYSPEAMEAITGVPAASVRRAARLYAASPASMIIWGLGITEAGHGSNAVFGLINMALLAGQIGRRGTGLNPLRGQNNVQGASDVGALPGMFSDYRAVTNTVARAAHETRWGVIPPARPGMKILDMMDAALDGRVRALWVVGEDLLQSNPDAAAAARACENLDFLVVQDIFLTETAKYAHVVLPAASYLEKDGTFVNSDRRVQRVRRVLEPLAGCKTDAGIIDAIAREMGIDLGFGAPPDPAAVMREIAALSPNWGGVSYERLEREGFLQWPCPSAEHPGTAIVHADGNFLSGKGRFTPAPWQPAAEAADAAHPYLLTTGRQLLHYNVGTMTRRTPLMELARGDRETLRLHPDDAKKLGIADGDWVEVRGRRGRLTVPAAISGAVNPGVVFMTFHFPETPTNVLTTSAQDEFSGCPEYKVTAVALRRVAAPAAAGARS